MTTGATTGRRGASRFVQSWFGLRIVVRCGILALPVNGQSTSQGNRGV